MLRLLFGRMPCVLCDEDAGESGFCAGCALSFRGALLSRYLPPIVLGGVPVFSAGLYSGSLGRYIRLLKGQPAGRLPGVLRRPIDELVDHWSSEIASLEADCIVPIPSGALRVVSQTDLGSQLADRMARGLGRPVLWNALVTTIFRFDQKGLAPSERRRNARFLAGRGRALLGGRRILLIDDVSTTGATLRAATLALEAAGASVVGAWVLARSDARRSPKLSSR